MTELFKRPFVQSAVLAVVCLTPLLLTHTELWDAVFAELAILRQDFSMIERMGVERGWYWAYYSYILFDLLSQFLGIPYKLFSNVLTVLSILGIARETYWFARHRFGLEREYAFVGAWGIVAFPIWHVLVSTGVFVNIICFWVFMAGVRYWYSNKLLALPLIVFSLQLYSLFSLAVGIAVCEFLLTVSRKTFLKKGVQTFTISLVLLLAFIGLTSVINVHGKSGTYNTITLDGLEYFFILLMYCAGILSTAFLIKLRMSDPVEAQQFMRRMAAIVALLFFAILPYVAVGRPMRYFAFGSFTARHTMLTCIPFALLFGVLVRAVAQRFGKKVAGYGCVFIVVALVVLLHQGYSHKAAAFIFKDMLTNSFQEIEAPPSGYVAIEAKGFKPPRHVQSFTIALCMYKAYGKSAWMPNGFWRRGVDLGPESLKSLYGRESCTTMCQDVSGDAYTKYVFTLTDYHQEGRFWYWLYYLFSDYSHFNPKLERVVSLPGSIS